MKATFKVELIPAKHCWEKDRFYAENLDTHEGNFGNSIEEALKAFISLDDALRAINVSSKKRVFMPSLHADINVNVIVAKKEEYFLYRHHWETPNCPGYYEYTPVAVETIPTEIKRNKILIEAEVILSSVSFKAASTRKEWEKLAKNHFSWESDIKAFLEKNPWKK